ncbi:MAG: acyltransferase family protein [Cellulomonas sp.]|uniref:acyltransferase family protein n=1 Tax=Cellulomonas sp. TaxID=40001 RepID=UPI00258BFFC6|nr:acyltransferase family protein [Cellulomonas sp.]MCR6704139.1 acyltransferase family protein [Cellulomonas sp.]
MTTTSPPPASGPRTETVTRPAAGAAGEHARTSADAAAEHRTRGGDGRIRGLDGLRAIAVLAVIAYHLWPEAVPGGFLGVDVFFVVSGFLITTLLLRQMSRTGRLDMPDFWKRRARRLLPALVSVLLVGTVAARLVETDLLVGIGRQWLGALTFSTNWLEIAAGTSYFDATAPELFQPFWSLAIEEQFYLLWPLVLLGLVLVAAGLRLRSGARAMAFVVAAGAVASAIAMAAAYTPGDDPTNVYYGTGTHLFGLLMGAAVAIAASGHLRLLPDTAWARTLPYAALVVLVGLGATMAADDVWTYRGGIVVGSLAALALVVACAQERPAGLIRALELRPAEWVGERSYGLYLWHWPVILVVSAALGDAPGSPLWWRTPLIALPVTFLLAALSHRFVETPVRRDGFRAVSRQVLGALRGPRPVARVAAVAAAVLVVGATVSVATAPTTSSTQRAIEAALQEIADREARGADDQDRDTSKGKPTAGATQAPTAGPTGTPSKEPTTEPTGTATPPGSAVIDGADVIGFGDSVLSAAAPTLYDVFPKIAIDAKPIRKWVDVPALVGAAAEAGKLRPIVLLDFGTNGGFKFDGSIEALDETLDIIGPDRQVIIYTVVGISYWVEDANAALVERVKDRPNVHVVDWHRYISKHSGLLHADRTHPNMKGVVAYADLLREELTTLAS